MITIKTSHVVAFGFLFTIADIMHSIIGTNKIVKNEEFSICRSYHQVLRVVIEDSCIVGVRRAAASRRGLLKRRVRWKEKGGSRGRS